MNRAEEVYHAAHMLPEGPFTAGEIAQLIMARHFIQVALGDLPRPATQSDLHADAYEAGWYEEDLTHEGK